MAKDKITLVLMPPEERFEHGQGYDVTCEICYFLALEDCAVMPEMLKMCGESEKGYFKIKE